MPVQLAATRRPTKLRFNLRSKVSKIIFPLNRCVRYEMRFFFLIKKKRSRARERIIGEVYGSEEFFSGERSGKKTEEHKNGKNAESPLMHLYPMQWMSLRTGRLPPRVRQWCWYIFSLQRRRARSSRRGTSTSRFIAYARHSTVTADSRILHNSNNSARSAPSSWSNKSACSFELWNAHRWR